MKLPWVSRENYDALKYTAQRTQEALKREAREWERRYDEERARVLELTREITELRRDGFSKVDTAPIEMPPTVDEQDAEHAEEDE